MLLQRLSPRCGFSFRCRAPTIFVEFYPAIVKKVQSTEIFDARLLNQQLPKPCIRNQMLCGLLLIIQRIRPFSADPNYKVQDFC